MGESSLNYEMIEHTADIGLRVTAPDLKRLFARAGLAVFDIIAVKSSAAKSSANRFSIELSADNIEELFVAWLNELISLSYAERVVFTDISISDIGVTSIKASVTGEDAGNYRFKTEIKAATYHGLSVTGISGEWKAEVIFDV